MKAPSWMKLYRVENKVTTENGAIYHLVISRNFALWKWLWESACASYDIPFYRYPQVFWAVTKYWWNFV